MAEHAGKPKVRFAGFTETWEQRKLGDLGSLKNGMNFKKDAMGVGFPFVTLQNIFGKTEIDVDNLGLAMASSSQLKDYNLLEGDVLFVRSSVKLEGVGEAAIVPVTLENTTYSGFVIRFRDEVGLSKSFKRFVFQTTMVRQQIMSQATDSANKNISQTVLSNLAVMVPAYEEQARIGTFFRHLDRLITLHQRKRGRLENIKKAMLEKMFPKNGADVPEVRFVGFTEAWEQRKLGEIGKAYSGVGFPDNEQGRTEGIPFFKVSDMNSIGNENELQNANNYVDIFQISRHKWKPITEVPAIFFAKVGAAVMLNRKRLVQYPFLLDNNTMAYSFEKGIWNISFGKSLFETIDLTSLVQVGALPSYNASDVEDIKIFLPSLPEQARIGTFFRQLDRLITLHQRKVALLQNIKKACLEKMFV